MRLFGIQNEAVREQINYVLDEDEIIGKGPNGTLSLVFDGIKRLNKGEKHLKITCDNAGGQNKNNVTIWFYLYLVICGYYESIELNFMIPGHTKFKCDGSFGLIKKLYRKTSVSEITKEIKSFSILVLTPPPLDYKRQEYLYQNIRPFVKDEYKDITCPRPFYTGNK